MPTTTIIRIIALGSHAIEFLADGSVDILDTERIGDPNEYVHLSQEEAYLLFTALYEQFKNS